MLDQPDSWYLAQQRSQSLLQTDLEFVSIILSGINCKESYHKARERDKRWRLRKQLVRLHDKRVYRQRWHDGARAAYFVTGC